jgi:hypothetical protein
MEKDIRIAILGFGSLLWDKRPEFDDLCEGWQEEGPTLPLEFSHISRKTRLGALTLVIDPKLGTNATVNWCFSKRKNVDDAFCDLRCREGTKNEFIGKMVVSEGVSPEAPAYEKAIHDWAIAKSLDAIVWTKLESSFIDEENYDAFLKSALNHIQFRLTPEGKAKAAEYVWRAPDFVKTPLRSILQSEPWFPKPKDVEKTD